VLQPHPRRLGLTLQLDPLKLGSCKFNIIICIIIIIIIINIIIDIVINIINITLGLGVAVKPKTLGSSFAYRSNALES
jgi:hypothetical protein